MACTQYSLFQVRGASTKYRLEVSGYVGNAGDSMECHNNRPFSTCDQDNNLCGSCAKTYKGAWWCIKCHYSNLNGEYLSSTSSHSTYANSVIWYRLEGLYYSLKFTEMKVRAIG